MGGSYRVSFDLAVMLLGASINLAGFPYSAGFLGKELLVFHTLRDDFVSYFVRGCWVVSFFFTPIYMFSLLLFVYFGPSKSPSSTYRGG
jgi:formate hydrogenlyase subunit 3/multisubunit Na+/H+ antiporter MnhD subunit